MGLEDIFGKELRKYYEKLDDKYVSLGDTFRKELRKDYENLANNYGLDYWEGSGYFFVSANKRLSEDADHRKINTPPWPGIKIHSPLSVEMYNVLKSDDFKEMLENREIDGIKVYLYRDDETKHKDVTIYVSPDSMPNLRNLLDREGILKKNGIDIQPALSYYYDQGSKIVFLNRMPIAPDAGIFARYSTDFTGKMNIDDDIIDKYRNKIDDDVWRVAADKLYPYIVAVSRSWLSKNEGILDYLLRNPSVIYTFITLKRINRETIAPDPNIILSYDWNNKKLKAYSVLNANTDEYNLSSEDLRISDHPKERLENFLQYGTADPQH
jgi:hypothetical protein